MKIEYIEDVNPDYPTDSIVRLFEFTDEDLKGFINDIEGLIEKSEEFILSQRRYITTTNCTLRIKKSNEDIGIERIKDKEFECMVTDAGYLEMIQMTKQFIGKTEIGKSHWLYDLNKPIDFLLSVDGKW